MPDLRASGSVKLASMKGAWLLGGTHLVAALIGTGIASAYCLAHWTRALDGATLRSDAAVGAHYAAIVDATRDDVSEHERALRAYVKVLDLLLNREPKSDLYASLAFDKSIALARLALVAENRGDNVQAVEQLKDAMLTCESSGRKNCGAENLRDWAARLATPSTAQPRGK